MESLSTRARFARCSGEYVTLGGRSPLKLFVVFALLITAPRDAHRLRGVAVGEIFFFRRRHGRKKKHVAGVAQSDRLSG